MGCGGCGGFGGGGANAVQPYKYSFTHTQFQAAALANNIQAFSLQPKQVLHGMILRPTIQFAGAGITDYKISVGIALDLERYVLLFDVDTAPAASNDAEGGPLFEMLSFTGAVSIRIAALAAGANLNQSTAGAVDLYVYLSVLP